MRSAQLRQRGGVNTFKYVMLLPAVIWVIAFTFFPLFSVIRYAFANYVLGRGITGYVGLHNFWTVLNSGQFWHSVFITAIYVAIAVPFVLAYIAWFWRQMDSKKLTVEELAADDKSY